MPMQPFDCFHVAVAGSVRQSEFCAPFLSDVVQPHDGL